MDLRTLSAANEKDGWGGFPFGVQTISLRKYSPPEAMRHLVGMGVSYFEVSASSHMRATVSDDAISEIRQLAARVGLKITAHGVNRFSQDHAANERVHGVHVKDHAEIGKKSESVVLGKGQLDVVALIKALRQIKFPADGALSLEYEANRDNPIDDLKTCLAVVKDAIAKSF